jgi:hypothetical protein
MEVALEECETGAATCGGRHHDGVATLLIRPITPGRPLPTLPPLHLTQSHAVVLSHSYLALPSLPLLTIVTLLPSLSFPLVPDLVAFSRLRFVLDPLPRFPVVQQCRTLAAFSLSLSLFRNETKHPLCLLSTSSVDLLLVIVPEGLVAFPSVSVGETRVGQPFPQRNEQV